MGIFLRRGNGRCISEERGCEKNGNKKRFEDEKSRFICYNQGRLQKSESAVII